MRLFGRQSDSSLKIKQLDEFIEMESKEQNRKQELISEIENTAKKYNNNPDTSKLEIAWTNIAVFDVFMIIEIVQAIFSVMSSINENLKKKSLRANKQLIEESITELIKDAKQTRLHINDTLPYVWMAVKKKNFITVPGVELLYECISDVDESKGENEELKIIPKILDTFLLKTPYIIPFHEILSLIDVATITQHVHINNLRKKMSDSPRTSTSSTPVEILVKQFDGFDYNKYSDDPSYRGKIGFELAIKHAMNKLEHNMTGGVYDEGVYDEQYTWLDHEEADSELSEETSLSAVIRIINRDIIKESDKVYPSAPNIARIATAIQHAKIINASKKELVSQTKDISDKIANMIKTDTLKSNNNISKIQDLITLEQDTKKKYPWIKILYPKPKSGSVPFTSKDMNLEILESIIADNTSQAGGINYKNYKKTRRRIKRQYRKKTNRRKK
jgi:hypothetical protein